MHGTARTQDVCDLSDISEIYSKEVNIENEASSLSENIMEEMFTSPNTHVNLVFVLYRNYSGMITFKCFPFLL